MATVPLLCLFFTPVAGTSMHRNMGKPEWGGKIENDHLRKTKDLATITISTGGIKKHKEHKKHKTPRSGPSNK
jgi:hypothetical protein